VQPRVHRFASPALLVDELYRRIEELSRLRCAERGRFDIVLAGGRTPAALYRRLRELPADWRRWHVYFSDERFLPPGDPGRNDSMAALAWLDHVAIPSGQVHRVPFAADVETAAAAYGATLAGVAQFDLALLGLGEDGHTASLFTGDPRVMRGGPLAIAVDPAPKPPPARVSMSPDCLGRAAAVWFIVTGEGKREALAAWLGGAALPPRLIEARAGIDVFCDI